MVMSQQMLILFAFFTESSKAAGQAPSDVSTQEAMAVFAFFLFVVYGLFGSLLAVFRLDIIKEEVLTDEAAADEPYEASEVPPQEYGYGEKA